MNKQSVLFINTRSELGADVAVHFSLIQHFDPQTIEVHIATNRNAKDYEKALDILRAVKGVRVLGMDLGHELEQKESPDRKSGKFSKLAKFKKVAGATKNVGALFSLFRLARYVVVNQIKVIHSTDRPRDAALSTLLAKLTRRKNVIHAHIKWYPNMGRLTEWALRECTVVLTISEFSRKSFVEGGIPASKVAIVYNSSDSKKFIPTTSHADELRKTLNLPVATPLVGIVARIMLYKGQRELIRSFARVKQVIPEAHLAIIGKEDTRTSGDGYKAQLETLVAELDLTDCVHFVGWSNAMPSVMSELDVLAMPSWEEPFGLAVTEAMLCERPVVGFASGALPEIVLDGKTGCLTPPMDTEAFANALIGLLKNPALREEMGKAGRRRAIEHFSPEEKSAQVVLLYRAMGEGAFSSSLEKI